ncbi:MAG: hypothetical protein WKF83_03955 [Nocardioidaceae bacterium]
MADREGSWVQVARTYGREYPEAKAYPEGVTPQAVVPIEYQLKPGQAYVVGDRRVITDYYKATTYDGSAPGDWTDFVGEHQVLLGLDRTPADLRTRHGRRHLGVSIVGEALVPCQAVGRGPECVVPRHLLVVLAAGRGTIAEPV